MTNSIPSSDEQIEILELFEDCIEADRDKALFTEDIEELRRRFRERGQDLDYEAARAWQTLIGPKGTAHRSVSASNVVYLRDSMRSDSMSDVPKGAWRQGVRLGSCAQRNLGKRTATLRQGPKNEFHADPRRVELLAGDDPMAGWTKGYATVQASPTEQAAGGIELRVFVGLNRDFTEIQHALPLRLMIFDSATKNTIWTGTLTPDRPDTDPVEIQGATIEDFLEWRCTHIFRDVDD